MTETADLRRIKTILAGWYKRPQQAKLWWSSPQPMFASAIPTEMVNQGRTTEMVRALVAFDEGLCF